MTATTPTTPTTPDDMHTLEIRMPIELAERLIAKAGSMDAAVHQALTAYLTHTAHTPNLDAPCVTWCER